MAAAAPRAQPAPRENPAPRDDISPAAAGRGAAGGATGQRVAGRRTLALFLLSLGFYLLTAGGHLYAVDEETLFRATESVVERGTLALPPDAWGLVTSEQRTGGALYSQYQPGQSLAALPFYLAGKGLARAFPARYEPVILRFAVMLLGAVVTAATVALLYRLGRGLGYRERVALASAATYGVATTAWPYARTFYAEPLTALLLLAAFHALRRGTDPSAGSGSWRWLAWGGAAAGLAVFAKPHALLVVPVLGLYLLARLAGKPPWSVAVARRLVGPALVWGVGFAVGVLPTLIGNAIMYGGPLRTGYSAGRLEGLAYPFLKGLYGLLLSSGKGVAWYSPPLLLALLAARPFYRAHRAEALACLGIALGHLAFYSRLSLWNGDWAWGPRYLVVILPFLWLPALAFLDTLRAARWRGALAGAIVAIGVGVQLLGVLVNPFWPRALVYDLVADNADRDRRIEARFFSPADSPIAVHARMLGERVAEWRDRALPPPDTATLGRGFGAVEGPADALFPRWTDGAATIALRSGGPGPLTVKLTFFDHRPPALRADRPVVLVDGEPLADATLERVNFTGDGEGWTYQVAVPADRATITLRSAPWNPRALGVGERDETLGLFVHNVEVWRRGQPWAVRDDAATAARRTIPAPPTETPRLYDWYNGYAPFGSAANGTTVRHLVDHWAWYTAVGGLPRGLAARSIAGFAAFGAAVWLLGAVLFLLTLPPGTLRRARPVWVRRTRPRRGAAGRRAPGGAGRQGTDSSLRSE